MHDGVRSNNMVMRVTRTPAFTLSLSSHSFSSQSSNPAELLRMYLTFDLLEPATLLAMEFIDAVCGHGKEFFGLKVSIIFMSPLSPK